MINPPLTAADIGKPFETKCGKRAFVTRWEEDDDKECQAYIIGEGIYAFSNDGRGYRDFHLARRLPTPDPITELERAVVEAAVDWGTGKIGGFSGLDAVVRPLIAARKPCPRRVNSPEALGEALAAAKLCMTPAQASAVFNALPEVKE